MKTKRHLAFIVLICVSSFIVGASALLLVQLVPSEGLRQNAYSALEVFEKAGIQRPSLASDTNAMRVDYYGDAHMYQLSLGESEVSALQNALLPRSYFDSAHPDELNNDQEVEGLRARLHGMGTDVDNGRYWNGFIVPLRLLGSILSYANLRMVNMAGLAILFVAATILIMRTLGWSYGVAFVLSLMTMWVWLVAFCLEYLSVFYVMGIGVIVVLLLAKSGNLIKWGLEVFLLLGILCAYFDLFTAPLVTLGFPLIVVVLCLLRSNHKADFAYIVKQVLLLIGCWLLGFVGFWALKIVLTQILFGRGILADVVDRLAGYTGARNLTGTFLYQIFGLALPANLGTLLGNKGQDVLGSITAAWVRTVIALLLLFVPPVFVTGWTRLRNQRVGAASVLLMIGALPFLRMAVTSVHSDWNSFFTFREFGVAYFAMFVFCIYLAQMIHRARVSSKPASLPLSGAQVFSEATDSHSGQAC